MDQLYLRQFEQRCTQEEPPACQTTCPLHVEARTFLALMGSGKVREARKCLDRTMPLSSLAGLLCDGPCLEHCVRTHVDSAVNIPLVERACVLQTTPGKLMALPGSGHHVAVVGASLSGLAVAHELAKKSHTVTVLYDFSLGEDCGQALVEEFGGKLGETLARRAVDEILAQLGALKVRFKAVGIPHTPGSLEAGTCPDGLKNQKSPNGKHAVPAPKATMAPDSGAALEDGTPPDILNEEFIKALGEEFAAVFMGFDDMRVFPSASVLPDAYAPVDSFTQQCVADGYFASGFARHWEGASPVGHDPVASESGETTGALGELPGTGGLADESSVAPRQKGERPGVKLTPIERVALGKRAAGSIARFLQGVDPATARENEFIRPTKLYTSTDGVKPVPAVIPPDGGNPTADEGKGEAARCIQCNCLECVKVCPYLSGYGTYPKKLAREIYNNLSVIKGLRQTNQTINSCAECGLCAAVCPNNVDMGLFCATARNEMVADNRMPPSAHEFALLDMEQSNDETVAFVRHQPDQEKSAYLFFPGCQLPASLPEETLMAYNHLCRYLEGGVGLFFHCCGAPARWSGRKGLTSATALAITDQWEHFGRPEVIVACASCYEFFEAELPHIPCRPLWDVLVETPLPFASSGGTFPSLALHDPCAAREHSATRLAVRNILEILSVSCEELPLSGSMTRCCGYGGLAAAANPSMGVAFARERIKDSPLPMVAYCAMCRERLAAEGKEVVHLLELLCGIEDWERALRRRPLGISERQYGRENFREEALTTVWQEKTDPVPDMPFTVSFDEGVERLMEERRIRQTDIFLVLEHAREHGPLFKDPGHKWLLASLRPRQVTFWVRYGEIGPDEYMVYDAYCHRMVVPGVPGEGGDTPCTLEGYATKGVR